LLILCFLIVVLTVYPVRAQVGSLWTSYDNNPADHQSEFAPSQIVYVFWSPTGSSQDIRIFDNNGVLIKDFGVGSSQPVQWQVPANAVPGSEFWVVIPGGAFDPFPIAVASVKILPENNWSVLTSVIAGFAVFAVFTKKKRDKKPLRTRQAKLTLTRWLCGVACLFSFPLRYSTNPVITPINIHYTLLGRRAI
jgi:hypothetical protein